MPRHDVFGVSARASPSAAAPVEELVVLRTPPPSQNSRHNDSQRQIWPSGLAAAAVT
eukprot:CAMPEP_0171244912 /NCGR_PEP_ID=MMETSP0790-20130122/47122_1 /TAXON_ID=2925 /ORGANISM="Alexandrium catenella, Strain OF101" /LENGTH=56 /DNA_ID=CAMNT_0011712101 /DNA_START=26 /DNA_END=191 /DNA_ORIENTATION=+